MHEQKRGASVKQYIRRRSTNGVGHVPTLIAKANYSRHPSKTDLMLKLG